MLKALVISPNERTSDLGCLLAIARSEACKREHVGVNPPVRALVFVAELGVYVAVYQVLDYPESSISKSSIPESRLLKNGIPESSAENPPQKLARRAHRDKSYGKLEGTSTKIVSERCVSEKVPSVSGAEQ